MNLDRVDWAAVRDGVFAQGYATWPGVLDGAACDAFARAYGDDARYRSTVRMQAHGFGRGEYRYFAYPLPEPLASLRADLYAALAPLANVWNEALAAEERYPAMLDEYLERCHRAGQTRPTPLILTYGEGDYNCLHQDVYGALAFPLQCTIFLSARSEFEGGESVFVMQRPRAQSRAAVVSGDRGDLLVFANRYRPVPSARGFSRENVRHGIAPVRRGRRYALGIIFHDAK